tara:strand:+ start:861 stop:1043 length:183 start_codon:yes stop_codon:yes gene_type:complete
MDYQNKRKFKKLQKKKKARDKKVIARRVLIQEENRVERLLDQMHYESRQRIRPIRKKKEE